MRHFSSTLNLATLSNPVKSQLQKETADPLPTKQGTIKCMSWFPFSSETITSEQLTVLLSGWNSYVISLHKAVSNSQVASDQLKVLKEITESLDIPSTDPIDFISIQEQRDVLLSSTTNMIYKFHWHSIIDVTRNYSLKQNLKKLQFESLGFSSMSSISHVSKCFNDRLKLSRFRNLLWDYSDIGPVYPTDITQCLSSNFLPVSRFCYGDFTNGAYLDIFNATNSCNIIGTCPQGYHSIKGEHCTLVTKPDIWIESLRKAYVTGQEFSICSSVGEFLPHYELLKTYIPNYVSKIWLPIRRMRKHGPFVSVEDNKDGGICNITEKSWVPGHPKFDKDCVAQSLENSYLYSVDCNLSLPFVSTLDTNGFLDNSTDNLNQLDSSCPKGSFSPATNLDHKVCIVTMLEKAESWSDANRICKSHGYYLPSPGHGFMNWAYRKLLNESDGSLFINASTVNGTNYYHYWAPGEKETSEQALMKKDGWRYQVKLNRSIPVVCEKRQIKSIGFDSHLNLYFINEESTICIKVSRKIVLAFDTLKCYVNGEVIKIDTDDNSSCESKNIVSVNQRRGYFSCSGWTRNPHQFIQSNELLKRPMSTYVYVFKILTKDILYNPLIHDPNHKEISSQKACESNLSEILLSITNPANVQCKHNYYAPHEQLYGLYEYSEVSFEVADDPFGQLVELISMNFGNYSIEDVRQTTGCHKSTFVGEKSEISLTFPETFNAGYFTPEQLCATEDGLPVTRACLGDYFEGYHWSNNLSGKCSTSNLSKITHLLYNQTQEIRSNTLKDIRNYTSESKELKPVDIYLISKTLDNILEHSSEEKNVTSSYYYEDFISVMDNILAVDESSFESVQMNLNTTNNLLSKFENLAFTLKSDTSGNVKSLNKQIVAERVNLSSNPTVIGFSAQNSLSQDNSSFTVGEEKQVFRDSTSSAIILPRDDETLKNLSDATISFVIFRNSKLFIEPKTAITNRTTNSEVVQASYFNTPVQNLVKPVKIFFRPVHPNRDTFCAFWDFKMHGERGGWSTIGCEKEEQADGLVVCKCYHLTNFALLMNYADEEIHEIHGYILETISIIGCSISILALILIFITFFLFKEWRKSQANKILFNLSLAVFCSMLLFVAGIDQSDNDSVCRSVAVGLHYFISVSFTWMLVEGFKQYMTFVKVIGTYIPKFMWKASIFAWGVPLLPIGAMLAYDISLYDGEVLDHKGTKICWMSHEGFMYGFLPPLVLTMTINLIIYCIIIDKAILRRAKIKSTVSKKDMQKQQIVMATCVFFLLGFTWIFGLLAVSGGKTIFSYLFCLFNTLQGFFLFFFHVFRERSARKQWNRIITLIADTFALSSTGSSEGGSADLHKRKPESETLSSKATNESEGKEREVNVDIKPESIGLFSFQPMAK